jgi:hypothetical protein
MAFDPVPSAGEEGDLHFTVSLRFHGRTDTKRSAQLLKGVGPCAHDRDGGNG